MGNLEDLQKLVVGFRDERNWQQFHNPKDVALSLVLEAAELMEHFQWKNEQEIRQHLQDKKTDVADELADVLYWVLLIAHDFEINLPQALKNKMKKNAVKYPIEKSKDKHAKYTEL